MGHFQKPRAAQGASAQDLASGLAPVVPGHSLEFPRDSGAHPDFRTEWWYVTGWLTDDQGLERGFQVTFFRVATGIGADNPSRFAPRQLILAHAALAWRGARDARAIGVRIRLAYAIVLLLCLPPWNRTERLSLDLLRRTLFSGVLVARRDLVDTVAAEGGYTGSME